MNDPETPIQPQSFVKLAIWVSTQCRYYFIKKKYVSKSVKIHELALFKETLRILHCSFKQPSVDFFFLLQLKLSKWIVLFYVFSI